jgi:hypothetical protein
MQIEPNPNLVPIVECEEIGTLLQQRLTLQQLLHPSWQCQQQEGEIGKRMQSTVKNTHQHYEAESSWMQAD